MLRRWSPYLDTAGGSCPSGLPALPYRASIVGLLQARPLSSPAPSSINCFFLRSRAHSLSFETLIQVVSFRSARHHGEYFHNIPQLPLPLPLKLGTPIANHCNFFQLLQARNSEKAQSMLFRFRAAQAADLGILDIGRTRRPKAITSVTSIPTCEKWRGQVLKEISRKVSRIQDPSLSDYQIRDLNDEINKAMREKWMWEKQIRDLGGPNYMRGGGRVYDDEGREIPGGGKGYRYFGRARELPGVKEMFEAAARRRRPEEEEEDTGGGRAAADLARKHVDAAYFGYGPDEEDGTLLTYERKKEKEAVENMLKKGEEDVEDGWEPLPGDAGDGVEWRLPTLDEVQEELVDRRRRRLLDKIS